jgi:undecaprenyl-diphosphatase
LFEPISDTITLTRSSEPSASVNPIIPHMIQTLIQAIVLGLIQGATEFIPISSSAHLIIVPWLLGWNDPVLTSLSFDIALHLGTLLAVLVYFAGDFLGLIRAWVASVRERCIGQDPERRLAWFILIGTLPGAVSGFLLESKIDGLFHQPGAPIRPAAMLVMAVIIAGLGALLLVADRLARRQCDLRQLTFKQTILIGLAQALAIFPGVSRSGSTITAGLATGLKREDAARFSFLLSAPIIFGAGLKGLFEIAGGIKSGAIMPVEWIVFPAGVITAAITGYLCIRFLLHYLQNHRVDIFVYYRFALALLIVVVALRT